MPFIYLSDAIYLFVEKAVQDDVNVQKEGLVAV